MHDVCQDKYEEAKRNKTVSRLQLRIQDKLNRGDSISRYDLKRLVANNLPGDIFEDAINDLADVGIIEFSEQKTKGRPATMITYVGYAQDSSKWTAKLNDEWHAFNQSIIDIIEEEQGHHPAIVNGVPQPPPPRHRLDKVLEASFDEWYENYRGQDPHQLGLTV